VLKNSIVACPQKARLSYTTNIGDFQQETSNFAKKICIYISDTKSVVFFDLPGVKKLDCFGPFCDNNFR